MEEIILKTVSEVLDCSVSRTTQKLDIPEWGSLKMLQIIMALDEIGICLPLEKIADIQGVPDIIALASGEPK